MYLVGAARRRVRTYPVTPPHHRSAHDADVAARQRFYLSLCGGHDISPDMTWQRPCGPLFFRLRCLVALTWRLAAANCS